jgi:adenylate cyclase
VVEARVERRLAAILAADIAGYSRLMGVDEEGTLRQLKAHRKELVDPKISEHRGRIVKTAGDGMLVEFVSVVDAVRCAVDIQRNMAERNAEVLAGRQLSNSHALLNFRKKAEHPPWSDILLLSLSPL